MNDYTDRGLLDGLRQLRDHKVTGQVMSELDVHESEALHKALDRYADEYGVSFNPEVKDTETMTYGPPDFTQAELITMWRALTEYECETDETEEQIEALMTKIEGKIK